MDDEILINVTPQETRVASVENGMLQEIHIERVKNKGLVGNIYLGITERVLPGMQAAFIDIGLQRTAFLHANNLLPRQAQQQLQQTDTKTDITALLTEGQRIRVQVVKDPVGGKGARVTAQISMPARHIVLLPGSDYLGISQRIQGTENRQRLLSMLQEQVSLLDISVGVILRATGEHATRDAWRADISFLLRVWQRITAQKETVAPALIHQDLPLAMRTVRDLAWQHVDKVRIDSRETYDRVKEFVRDLIPDAVDRIEHYPGDRPIFELYGVEDEIQKALLKKVSLKSGGYLIIDQAEAMTTIDINTGSFIGRRNLEETIFRTNLEAVTTLARQLMIRNIGGVIIVDFINMAVEEHCNQVMQTLKRELEKDPNKAWANQMSILGLVEITRKRNGKSLEQLLTQPCCVCDGRGIQKTPQTICYEIFREILRTANPLDARQYLVVASPPIVDVLSEDESVGIAELATFINCEIKLQAVSAYNQEQFDVVLM